MMSPRSAVDVLIPTYRRPAALASTLTALAGQDSGPHRLVLSDQGGRSTPALGDPLVEAVLRVLRVRGWQVETHTHLPPRGMAEHRDFLLARVAASRCLFLDDDVVCEPSVLGRLQDALDTLGCGFVGAAVIGLSHLGDVRTEEQAAFQPVEQVRPERIRKGTPAWERWRLHNAATPLHLGRRTPPGPRGWTAYRVAWIGGCVLYDTAKLRACGGFGFHGQLPPGHAGEDVVAQLRVQERFGGAGVLPSGAYHLELPTTVTDRRADAYRLLEAADRQEAPAGTSSGSPPGRTGTGAGAP